MSTPLRTRPGQAPPSLAELGIEYADWETELEPAFIRLWGNRDNTHEPEALTVYGKSGTGKSTFMGTVVDKRAQLRGAHVVYVATKPTDRTIQRFGWKIISDWPPGYNETKVVYWARAKNLSREERAKQRAKVRKLMDGLWTPNANIIVVWDELVYIEQALGLKLEIETFYREGRALGITNVASMQRPSGVNRLAHSESGWSAAFPPKDQDDRDRVAEVLGDRARFRIALEHLDRSRREFILRDDRTGETYVTHLPDPRRAGLSRPVDRRVRSRQ